MSPGPGARPKLTKRVVDAATCPPGKKDLMVFCGELKGFGLRVTAGGAKVFFFQYRAGSAVRRMVLGDYGVVTVDRARAEAEILRGQVRKGEDPKEARQAARRAITAARAAAAAAAKADTLTFQALTERWRDLQLGNRGARYQKEAPRALLAWFSAWATRPAHSITAAEAVLALDKVRADSGPGAARSAYLYARGMYAWASKRQMLEANPFAVIQGPERVKDRDRVLADEEVAEIWRAAEGLGWPMGAFTQFALLTLQRREEAAGLRWAELSPDLSLWTLPAERAKNGKAHVVHLAPAARAILKAAPRMKSSPFVFTTTGKAPVSGFSRAKAMIDAVITAAREKAKREPAELEPWRLHDFRRTGVTRLAALGFPPHVCDRLLNHVQGAISGVAAIYQRHEFFSERQQALEAWARHVVALSTGKPARKPKRSAEMVQLLVAQGRRR